jgi:IS1 family transposase
MLDRSSIIPPMNRLTTAKRAAVVAALVEGNSIRATVRMTGVAKNTVIKLLADLGTACATFHDSHVRNLNCRRVQADEIWAFCYARRQNLPRDKQDQFGYGDVWTWTAIDADSKLAVSWLVGERYGQWAEIFMRDVASRLANRVQLSTDGLKVYLEAVDKAFQGEVDYGILRKVYGSDPRAEKRYSPPICIAAKREPITGNPDPKHVSTSYVERQNLTMRMSMRRFTRLTNAFSKKIENLMHAVAIHFVHYNFVRVHQSLRVTPAMEAGLASRPWTVADLIALLEKREAA